MKYIANSVLYTLLKGRLRVYKRVGKIPLKTKTYGVFGSLPSVHGARVRGWTREGIKAVSYRVKACKLLKYKGFYIPYNLPLTYPYHTLGIPYAL